MKGAREGALAAAVETRGEAARDGQRGRGGSGGGKVERRHHVSHQHARRAEGSGRDPRQQSWH